MWHHGAASQAFITPSSRRQLSAQSVGRQQELRYFDREELARRYESYRPQVHVQVIRTLAGGRSVTRVGTALDVACGTGHSTSALSSIAGAAFGCELSRTMLACAPSSAPPLVQAAAEALPFRSNAFDLLTVSMAFHWFEQARFLSEAARVLAPNGEIWVYNLVFPGVLVGEQSFSTWHNETYLARFPSPSRHSETLESLVSGLPLEPAEDRWFSFEVPFSAVALRSYLTTQSNIEVALRVGTPLTEIDRWLDSELAPFFEKHLERRFVYACHSQIAVAA